MDPKNTHNDIDSTYRLLALCARAEGHPAFYTELKKQVRAFTAWDNLPAQAEVQGMSSLFWHHIQGANIKIPTETQRVFKGLTLRTRAYNRILARALAEMIPTLKKAGIQPLLLKGLALAYQYYPDPNLRPVSDIDLYFDKQDFLRAAQVLQQAGYKVQLPSAPEKRLPKSLTADRSSEGINVHVELHHYDPKGGHEKGNIADIEFADFHALPLKIRIDGLTVLVPDTTETLLFLSKHFAKHLFAGSEHEPAQLKWVADIINLVEHHARTMDWAFLKTNHPELINRLELFYSLTPLPKRLAKSIPVQQIILPGKLGQYPPGWPHQKIREWKQVGPLPFLYRMLLPPAEWWTRLYYGISRKNIFWYRYVVYRRDILKAALRTSLFYLRNGF